MKITIIGCGHMGTCLAERLSQTNQLSFYDHHLEKAEHLAQQGYGKMYKNIKDALHASEVIILAVRPQNLKQAANLIKEQLQESQFLVSILAGTNLTVLRSQFPSGFLVRMMPNLPVIYGEGVIGLCSDEKVRKEDKEPLTKMFEGLGKTFWISEEKIDGLTALTSSGPAFFFTLVEAMIDAGIVMGFTAKDAQSLIYQMLQGSLTMLQKTHKHPGELKWQIASPEGMTIAGLKRLEELALRGGIINTFLAAYAHAKHLASLQEEKKQN